MIVIYLDSVTFNMLVLKSYLRKRLLAYETVKLERRETLEEPVLLTLLKLPVWYIFKVGMV